MSLPAALRGPAAAENFPVAPWWLPRRQRRAIEAIYGFARHADDLADEGDLTVAERAAALADQAAALDAIERGETPPGHARLAAAIRDFSLPLDPLRALLSAFNQDLHQGRYADLGELMDYCRRSANPIGHLLLQLHGIDQPANRGRADAVCTGLQLTNLLQDLGPDLTRRDRLYLPQAALARHGLRTADLAAGRMDASVQALLYEHIQIARRLLQLGAPLARALPWRAGLALRLAVLGAARVLERLHREPAAVYRGLRLNRRDRLLILAHALRHSLLPRRR